MEKSIVLGYNMNMKKVKIKKVTLLIILIVFYFSITASAANWPSFGRNQNGTRYASEVANPPLVEKWKFTTAMPIVSSPATSFGIIYFGSRDKKVYALDAYTKDKKWEFETGGWVDSTPAVSDGFVYVCSRDGYLYSLDAKTGALKWKYQTGGTDTSSPLVVNGVVYCGSGYPNQFVYALNAYSGDLLWKSSTSQYVYSSPAMSDNTIYIGANDGKFYSFSAPKGEIKFAPFATSGEIYFSSPAIANKIIYGVPGKYDKNLYAIDSESGKSLWSVQITASSLNASNVSSISITEDGKLYVGSGDVGSSYILTCIDINSHAVLWQTKAPDLTALGTLTMLGYTSSPAATKNNIFIGSGDKKLYVVNADNGTIIESHTLDGEIISSPIVSNGWIYVATLNGSLYAFESSEIVTISSPELNELKNGEVNIYGMTKISGFQNYTLQYGEGQFPSSWMPIVQDKKESLSSNGILGTLKSGYLNDGEWTIQLSVSTSSGVKIAKSSFFVANSSARVFIKASDGGTVTAPDGTSIVIPAGAMNQDDFVNITKPAAGSYSNEGLPANVHSTNVVREFSFSNSTTKLSKYAAVTIPYIDSEVQGVAEEELRIYVWDDSKKIYKIVNTSQPAPAANKVSAQVSYLGMYRLMEYSPSGPLLSEETTYTYPNPAKGELLTFKCYLGDSADISIDVYNIAGEKVAHLTNNGLGGMTTETVWNIKDIASAVYIFRVEAVSLRNKERKNIIKKLAIIH